MKLVYSEYVPSMGVSIVEISHAGQLFDGIIKLLEEDEDVASSYAGCYFAELKAIIKVYKYQRRQAQIKLDMLTNIYQQLTQLREFPYEKHSRVCRHIRKQLKLQQQEVDLYKLLYTLAREEYPKIVEERLQSARNIPEKLAQVAQKKELNITTEGN